MSALVPLTKSASPDEHERARLARRRRYAAQKTAADILPGHRVCSCGWRPPPGGQIGISRRRDRHFVSGVAVCGSVWACPVCAAKIAVQRAAELQEAIERFEADGGCVWMLTLTIDHTAKDDLDALLKRFTEAMRQLWAGKWGKQWRSTYQQVGMVRNLEVTWGFANGWHPHCHALLFVRSKRDREAEREIKARWKAVAARYGFRVSLQRGAMLELAANSKAAAEYAAKGDKSNWGAAEEVTWANIKNARKDRFTPFALLAACDGDEVGAAPVLFQTYADAFKGRRQLYWSRGLRAKLGLEAERSDEELANADDEQSVFVCAVSTDIFCWLKARGHLPDLLDVADEDGLDGINALLSWAYDCRMFEASERRRLMKAA